MKMQRSWIGIAIASLTTCLSLGQAARADFLRSYCTYTPHGQSQPTVAMDCTFSQRQGFVDISWEDGVVNSFKPMEGRLGTYTDQRGGLVYRQSGRDGADLVFKMEAGDVLVFW